MREASGHSDHSGGDGGGGADFRREPRPHHCGHGFYDPDNACRGGQWPCFAWAAPTIASVRGGPPPSPDSGDNADDRDWTAGVKLQPGYADAINAILNTFAPDTPNHAPAARSGDGGRKRYDGFGGIGGGDRFLELNRNVRGGWKRRSRVRLLWHRTRQLASIRRWAVRSYGWGRNASGAGRNRDGHRGSSTGYGRGV